MTQLINEIITRLFVEQPLASPGSANYIDRGISPVKSVLPEISLWFHILLTKMVTYN